jgi:iron-sulfur cluster repair protein YtfE (RIC family)
MSDIVERLREHFGDMPDRVHSSTFGLVVEAADEIDRLREELRNAMANSDYVAFTAVYEERDRLREALERIAQIDDEYDVPGRDFADGYDAALEIARAALAKEAGK